MQIKIMYEENKWTVGSKSKWYDNSNQQIAWIILENQNWILNHLMANKSRKSQNGFLLFFLTGEPTAPLRWRSQLPLCVLAGEKHLAARAIPLRQVWKRASPCHEAVSLSKRFAAFFVSAVAKIDLPVFLMRKENFSPRLAKRPPHPC